MVNKDVYQNILKETEGKGATLVAVSKLKSAEDIQALYALGQRHFGENYVQDLVDKQAELPADINWHFIGHLQSNKVKYIAPFVHLVHAVDSFKLLQEIDKQGEKNNRIIDVLLQQHIAQEDTKHGLDSVELEDTIRQYTDGRENLQNIRIRGLMGMASFTEDEAQVGREFETLNRSFQNLKSSAFAHKEHFDTLSMGMSGDYALAISKGSTMIRVGSALFGTR